MIIQKDIQIQHKLKKKKLIKEKHINPDLKIIRKIRNKINGFIKNLSGPAMVMIFIILFTAAMIFVKFYAEHDPIVPVEGDNIPNLMLITFAVLMPVHYMMAVTNEGEPWGFPI